MTALNWERNRRMRLARDLSTDFPPLTGSFEDQRRYGVFPLSQRGSHRQPSVVSVKSREHDFRQLHLYAASIAHPDFVRKGHRQQSELVDILRKLIDRCEVWGRCT